MEHGVHLKGEDGSRCQRRHRWKEQKEETIAKKLLQKVISCSEILKNFVHLPGNNILVTSCLELPDNSFLEKLTMSE